MTSSSVDVPETGHAALRARIARGRRKKFLILAIAALGLLATVLGVSFTADTGTATANIAGTTGNTSLVYTSGLPSGLTAGGKDWVYGLAATTGSPTGTSAITQVAPEPPSLAAATVGANGNVKYPGDVALIDATSTTTPQGGNIIVSAYLTNAAAFAAVYPTFALPVELYCTTATGTTTIQLNWATGGTEATPTGVTSLTNSAGGETYLTDAQPSLSWSVNVGTNSYCEVAMDAGGAYYASSSSTTTLPQIYVTAQTAGAVGS
jgi:hypothetical protein